MLSKSALCFRFVGVFSFQMLYVDVQFTEMGDAELREAVAARLGVNGEAILQNLINTGKAELIMVGEEGNEVAFVRIKSYQWRNETGLRCDQTLQGVQKKT